MMFERTDGRAEGGTGTAEQFLDPEADVALAGGTEAEGRNGRSEKRHHRCADGDAKVER